MKRPNVPLPAVIQPEAPKLERKLSAPKPVESSFATIGRPDEGGGATLGLSGETPSIVTLPAATSSPP